MKRSSTTTTKVLNPALLLNERNAACDLIGPDGTEGWGFELDVGKVWVCAPACEEALLVVEREDEGGRGGGLIMIVRMSVRMSMMRERFAGGRRRSRRGGSRS